MKAATPSHQNFTLVVSPELINEKIIYVGQCVEYDICVQGASLKEIKERFLKSIWGHIVISLEHGLIPFACLPPGNVEPPADCVPSERFPATPSRNRLPSNWQDNWNSVPRGEVMLQMA
jgi:hypothetical protein